MSSKAQTFLEELKDLKDDLEKLLLSKGGDSVLIRTDDDIDKVLRRGKLFTEVNKTVSSKMKGKDSQCHFNASRCWDANKDKTQLVTGFYLLDGIWREHSWVLLKGKVVETTSNKADMYFGYIMTADEAEDFYWDNE